jgi:hypothetical protein
MIDDRGDCGWFVLMARRQTWFVAEKLEHFS